MLSVKQSLLDNYPAEEIDSLVERKKGEYSGLLTEEGALRLIAREKGVVLPEAETEYADLTDVAAGQSVNCVLEFQKIYPEKQFEKNGRKGRLASVDVSCNGKTARLVLWNSDASFLQKQGVARNCVVRAKRLLVKTLEPLELHSAMATELFLEKTGSHELSKISDAKEGVTISFACSLVEKGVLREFERDGRKSAVLNCLVADDSGSSKIVFWGDHAFKVNDFEAGEQLRVEDASMKNGELQCSWTTRVLRDKSASVSIKTTSLSQVSDGFQGIIEAVVHEIDDLKTKQKPDGNVVYVKTVLSSDKTRMPCIFFNDQAMKFLGLNESSSVDLSTLFKLKKDSLMEKKIILQVEAKTSSFSGETELVCKRFLNFVN